MCVKKIAGILRAISGSDHPKNFTSAIIAAAGLDVLCEEPMNPNSPFLHIEDSKRLLITPHIAWASVEARTNLMKIVLEQIKEFFS